MKRRNALTLINLVILPLLLVNFQNCAPASSVTSAGSGSQVRIVEDLNKSQIQFVSNSVELQDDVPQTGLDGFCNSQHDGASLRWSVIVGGQDSARPLQSGESVCRSGQFNVQLAQIDQMVCGVSHLLVVEGDWGASSFTHFTRRCQPLASQPVEPPVNSPMGTSCSLEYSPATAAENPCLQVCYRDAKVVLTLALDVAQCSGLAHGLAAR